MLKLYTARGSCGRASHIALEESGLDFEAQVLDLSAGQQHDPAYLQLNPKGRVPVLVTDRGVLTESPAILAYIASLAPAARLAPLDDAFQFAAIQAFNAYLSSTVHVAHAHRFRGARWADQPESWADMQKRVPQNMRDCFAYIEAGYLQGNWVMGADYSLADPYLFTISGWLEADGVDMREFPKVADHHARMLERPAVQRVLAAEQATA